MGKAIARKRNKSVAEECLKLPEVQKYVKQIGILLRRELRAMHSNTVKSVLQCKLDPEEKLSSLGSVMTELAAHAPILLEILKNAPILNIPGKTGVPLFVFVQLYL